ncbi:spectrin binding protein [Aureococcus anophagefferens]|uniref:Spectrin binding protein n=1 Tax=Aureococcus anophagefferens TaxID=44056 RepID=A0ABR1FNM9_AURAN
MADDWPLAIAHGRVAYCAFRATSVTVAAVDGDEVRVVALGAVPEVPCASVEACDVAWVGRRLVVCASDGTVRCFDGDACNPTACVRVAASAGRLSARPARRGRLLQRPGLATFLAFDGGGAPRVSHHKVAAPEPAALAARAGGKALGVGSAGRSPKVLALADPPPSGLLRAPPAPSSAGSRRARGRPGATATRATASRTGGPTRTRGASAARIKSSTRLQCEGARREGERHGRAARSRVFFDDAGREAHGVARRRSWRPAARPWRQPTAPLLRRRRRGGATRAALQGRAPRPGRLGRGRRRRRRENAGPLPRDFSAAAVLARRGGAAARGVAAFRVPPELTRLVEARGADGRAVAYVAGGPADLVLEPLRRRRWARCARARRAARRDLATAGAEARAKRALAAADKRGDASDAAAQLGRLDGDDGALARASWTTLRAVLRFAGGRRARADAKAFGRRREPRGPRRRPTSWRASPRAARGRRGPGARGSPRAAAAPGTAARAARGRAPRRRPRPPRGRRRRRARRERRALRRRGRAAGDPRAPLSRAARARRAPTDAALAGDGGAWPDRGLSRALRDADAAMAAAPPDGAKVAQLLAREASATLATSARRRAVARTSSASRRAASARSWTCARRRPTTRRSSASSRRGASRRRRADRPPRRAPPWRAASDASRELQHELEGLGAGAAAAPSSFAFSPGRDGRAGALRRRADEPGPFDFKPKDDGEPQVLFDFKPKDDGEPQVMFDFKPKDDAADEDDR